MANPNNRDGIEAIGSQQAASANAAANIQFPQRQIQAPTPTTPHRPVEIENPHGPSTLRRGDWLQLSPMASQKVGEVTASGGPRYTRRNEIMEEARESPHGDDLASIAKGETTAEEFKERRKERKDR